MTKISDVRKAKAKAILDDTAKGFNQWTRISDFVKFGILFSIAKDDPRLPDLLISGLFEVVEPEPCERASSAILSDPNRVALQPTEKGIACHYWFTRYNEQRRATDAAYAQGRKDVAIQLFDNIANSVGLDFEALYDESE